MEPLAGSVACSTGWRNRAASSCGCSARCSRLARVYRRAPRARSRSTARAEARSWPRVTFAISTFAPRACPTTSVRRRSRFGSAASSARRSRCCIAGLLSRLVHVHGVPIRASSTEGDCLALARPRLAEPSARYAARLVRDLGRGRLRRARSPMPGPCRLCATSLPSRSIAVRGRHEKTQRSGDDLRARRGPHRGLARREYRVGRGRSAYAVARRCGDEPVLRRTEARRDAGRDERAARIARRRPPPMRSSFSRRGAGTSTTRGGRSSSVGSKPAAARRRRRADQRAATRSRTGAASCASATSPRIRRIRTCSKRRRSSSHVSQLLEVVYEGASEDEA